MHIKIESRKVILTAENQAEEYQLKETFENRCLEIEWERTELNRVRVSFYIDVD